MTPGLLCFQEIYVGLLALVAEGLEPSIQRILPPEGAIPDEEAELQFAVGALFVTVGANLPKLAAHLALGDTLHPVDVVRMFVTPVDRGIDLRWMVHGVVRHIWVAIFFLVDAMVIAVRCGASHLDGNFLLGRRNGNCGACRSSLLRQALPDVQC